MYTGNVTDFALLGVFLQDGAQEEHHSKTKQESAWLFRLWYTFDHKYPFFTLVCTTKKSVLSTRQKSSFGALRQP